MAEITSEHRLWLLSGLLMQAAKVSMWCFSLEGELYYSTCPQEDDLRVFLELSGCLDYGTDRNKPLARPLVLTDQIGAVWILEHRVHVDGLGYLVVTGPIFTSNRSVADIDRSLNEMNIDLGVKFRMFRIMESIPVLTRSMVKQYAIMLHFAMTEQGISSDNLLYRDQSSGDLRHGSAEELPQPDEVDLMRAERCEELLLAAVREGSSDYMAIAEEGSRLNGGVLIINTQDQLRDAKSSLTVFCALVVRAAIQGGAVLYAAKMLEKRYLTEIARCRSFDRLIRLKADLLKDCVDLVLEAKATDHVSREIRSCCDYIQANVTQPLSVELLAKRFGYTEYYFTKKFYKEVGVRLGEYIKDARINHAKVLLRTTTSSIDDISFDLQFSNRNYFSKVFHDKVGMTPVAYRAKSGILSGSK